MINTKFATLILVGALAVTPSFAESREDVRAICKAEMEAKKAMTDTNGDGEVSQDERTAHMTALFYEISGGQDATTAGEIHAHQKAKRENSECAQARKALMGERRGKGRRGERGEKPSDDTVVTLSDFLEKGEKRHQKRGARKQKKREKFAE